MKSRKTQLSNILTYKDIEWYVEHPVDFIHDKIFHVESVIHGGTYNVTWQQEEILNALVASDRVSVRAGRGIGKTSTLSWIVLWWMCMFPNPKVVCTAPTFPQLQSVLWPEISQWLDKSLLKPYFTKTAKHLYLTEKGRDISFAEPRTASKEEAAQGLHCRDLLVLADEAPGIEDKILETIEGSFTEDNNKFLMMGNPSKVSGFFYDTHNAMSDKWSTHKFSSADSPVVKDGYIEYMKKKYVHGESVNYMYKVHVLGEFPEGDVDALIPLYLVEAAMLRSVKPDGPIEIGVDVAHKGDDSTVICARVGNFVEPLEAYAETTIPQVIDLTIDMVKKMRKKYKYEDIIRVKVDGTGVGAGVVDGLDLDTTNGIEVVPCNFGGASDEKYSNEASIMWGNLRDCIEEVSLPDDELLKEEISTRRWEFDNLGKVRIESKKTYKKDFGSSPDRADAVILAFARKENERKFVKGFSYSKHKSTNIGRNVLMSGHDRYCAIYSSPSQLMSAVFCSHKAGTLGVFDTFEGNISELDRMISYYAPYTKIIGSNDMFGKGGDDIATQYMTRGIYLMEVYNYDELGSIKKLDDMLSDNKILIARECGDIMEQLRYWTAGKRSTELKERYGFCYALTYAVAERMNVDNSNIISFKQPLYAGGSSFDSGDPNDGFLSI